LVRAVRREQSLMQLFGDLGQSGQQLDSRLGLGERLGGKRSHAMEACLEGRSRSAT
jgi:hypothetical protein